MHPLGLEKRQWIESTGMRTDLPAKFVGLAEYPISSGLTLGFIYHVAADAAGEVFSASVYHRTRSEAERTKKPNPFTAEITPGPGEKDVQFNVLRPAECVLQYQSVLMCYRIYGAMDISTH